MWLLQVDTQKLEYFEGEPPPYVILSHRWGEGEVTFQDVISGSARPTKDYRKLVGFCNQVIKDYTTSNQTRKTAKAVKYGWIDTCCIDKTNSSELSEAINSMYKWYASAVVCYVYLADVKHDKELERSVWFDRGWTLQELLAPSKVSFFSSTWDLLGDRNQLFRRIRTITGISESALRRPFKRPFTPSDYSVADRMCWASRRQTAREEDAAYSLLGIFNVNMPLIYGEGKRAFYRLQEEIMRTSEDLTIFAWQGDGHGDFEMLAASPESFDRRETSRSLLGFKVEHVADRVTDNMVRGITHTSAGITINLMLKPYFLGTYLVPLCWKVAPLGMKAKLMCIAIRRNEYEGCFGKVAIDGQYLLTAQDITNVCLRETAVKLGTYFSAGVFPDAELRRVILGRGRRDRSDFHSPMSYYFTIDHIASGFLAGGVDLVSRFEAPERSGSLIMHAGSSGMAGMVRLTVPFSYKVLLLFGHDFEYNMFCLVLLVSNDGFDGAGKVRMEFCVPEVRKRNFQIASNMDMLALVKALQDPTRSLWNLEENGMELHQHRWKENVYLEFIVADRMRVSVMTSSHSASHFQVLIYPAHATINRDLPESLIHDWHVQPWSQPPELSD